MRNILNRNLQRQLTLFEIIVEDNPQSKREMRRIMGIDEKTIKKDVQEINNIIFPIKVETDSFGHFFVEWSDSYDLAYIYSCFLSSSTEFKLLEKIIVEEKWTFSELADALFVSLSTLRRCISRLNSILQDHNMKIVPNPVRVRGDESEILNFLYNYLREKYVLTDRVLTEFESGLIDEIVSTQMNERNKKWTFSKSEQIKWLVKSIAIRRKNGNFFDVTYRLETDEIKKIISGFRPYISRFERVFGVPFSTQFIGLKARQEYATSYNDLKQLAQSHEKIQKKVDAIFLLLTKLEEKFGLHNDERERLIVKLYNVLLIEFKTQHIIHDYRGNFVKSFQFNSPMFIRYLKQLYNEQEGSWSSHQYIRFAFELLTEWEGLIGVLNKTSIPMTIGLYFSTTDHHILFIEEELRKSLSSRVKFLNLNNHMLAELDSAQVDLILTNINDLPTKKNNMCISAFPSKLDAQRINEKYQRWLQHFDD